MNVTAFTSIVDETQNRVFSAKEAGEIIQKLAEWDHWVAIQRCPFDDKPEIKVAKTIELPNGKKAHTVRDFAKLSLGQQQSILLRFCCSPAVTSRSSSTSRKTTWTASSSTRPLCDHSGRKEHRQVIIVTHNANIAVLGDAELIIPLRGASEVSVIRDRGSIDTEKTKDIVCTILEGSRRAYIRRHELYGY